MAAASILRQRRSRFMRFAFARARFKMDFRSVTRLR
jgi:hypothetical protein